MKYPQDYSTEMQEVILFYIGLDVPTRQILDSKGAIPNKTVADTKVSIQEMAEYSQKWHNGTSKRRSTETSDGLAAIQVQLNNLGREIKKNALVDLGARVSVMPLLTYLNLGLGKLAHTKLTVELAGRIVKHLEEIAENVLVGIGMFVFTIDFIILDMPYDVKVPLFLGRPFLSTAHTKIDVFKRKITLRVGDEKIIFKSMKPASSLIKMVYMLSLRERMELDLEARLMRETLVLNRSLDPFYGDYIKLNDLNVPLEHRRDQVDDLMPTIEDSEVIDEPMIDIIKTRNNENFDEYPIFVTLTRRSILTFYNSIMKDKVEYKGKNIVGAFINVPIFVSKFSIVTYFAVVENMDSYRDEAWEMSFLENHSAKLHVWKQEGLMG
ncbi:putative reverse transcriptase domain-containing protein [Tanacetum coccineum]